MTTEQILNLIEQFYSQRPGFDSRDYGRSISAYRADRKQANDGLTACKHLMTIVHRRLAHSDNIIGETLRKELSSGGRLELANGSLRYTTGQYFPTEYRWAAAKVLHSAVWADFRSERKTNGEPVYKNGGQLRQAINNTLPSGSPARTFNR